MENKEKVEMLLVILAGSFVLAGLIAPMLPSGGGNQFVSGGVVGGQQGETITCADSDGGLNFDIKGTCTDVANGVQYTDYCDKGILNEYHCAAAGCETVIYKCPYGCFVGICLPPIQV